jgi:hypothetical protein
MAHANMHWPQISIAMLRRRAQGGAYLFGSGSAGPADRVDQPSVEAPPGTRAAPRELLDHPAAAAWGCTLEVARFSATCSTCNHPFQVSSSPCPRASSHDAAQVPSSNARASASINLSPIPSPCWLRSARNSISSSSRHSFPSLRRHVHNAEGQHRRCIRAVCTVQWQRMPDDMCTHTCHGRSAQTTGTARCAPQFREQNSRGVGKCQPTEQQTWRGGCKGVYTSRAAR